MSNVAYSIELDLDALQAVACAASGEETRYYLKGVYLEYSPTHVHMTATDGHKLITLRQPYTDGDAPRVESDTLPPSVIVPSDLIGKLKLPKRAQHSFVTLTVDGARLTFDCGDATVGGVAVDGTYPDYRRVIPRETSGKLAQFDANILAPLAKARAKLLGRKSDKGGQIHVLHNGESPALVNIASGTSYEAVAVAMPYRAAKEDADAALAAVTTWATASLASPMIPDETDADKAA